MPAVIRTFGLYWDNTLVKWKGKRGRKGHGPRLLGAMKATDSDGSRTVDFWEQVGFYALFDEASELVYVGQTGVGKNRLGSRLRTHLSDELMGRWRYFSWFGLGWVPTRSNEVKAEQGNYSTRDLLEVLHPIEVMLIHLTEPHLNRSWGNKNKQGMERYYQLGQMSKWLGQEPADLPDMDDIEADAALEAD